MTADESWLPVVGYEGIYEVSDHGSVRSLDRRTAAGRFQRGRAMSLVKRAGRVDVRLTRDGVGRTRFVHHLVLEAFVGPRPAGMQACHFNGNGHDNRLSNLRWDTQSGNQLDAVRLGEHALASRTKCKRGHQLAEPNLCNYGKRAGVRACLACNKARRYLAHHPNADMQLVSDEIYARIMSGDFQQRSA